MTTPLFIPKTITIGFQKRPDTYTGKLAYIIYTDAKGKLRKETSWNGWRDKTIEAVTYDNTPRSNFALNKGVQRSREWFGSGRSMIRIYDQNDFEFEITVDNLLNVLAHADVSKRDITEPCVYAWSGTNLVLLPANSEEYQTSLKHSAKQGGKISAKDMVAGHTYSIKANMETTVMYIGRIDRFTISPEQPYQFGYTGSREQKQREKKFHAFMDMTTHEVLWKDPSSYISCDLSEEVHPEYANLVDRFYRSAETQPVIGAGLHSPLDGVDADSQYYYRNKTTMWYPLSDTEFVSISFNLDDDADFGDDDDGDGVIVTKKKVFAHKLAEYRDGKLFVNVRSETQEDYYVETATGKEVSYDGYTYYNRPPLTRKWRRRVTWNSNTRLRPTDPRVKAKVAEVKELLLTKPLPNKSEVVVDTSSPTAYVERAIGEIRQWVSFAEDIGGFTQLAFKLQNGTLAIDYLN